MTLAIGFSLACPTFCHDRHGPPTPSPTSAGGEFEILLKGAYADETIVKAEGLRGAIGAEFGHEETPVTHSWSFEQLNWKNLYCAATRAPSPLRRARATTASCSSAVKDSPTPPHAKDPSVMIAEVSWMPRAERPEPAQAASP